ncbi:MAG: hypothetical protein ABL994_25985 [Verrucomicrobiales bacterium]
MALRRLHTFWSITNYLAVGLFVIAMVSSWKAQTRGIDLSSDPVFANLGVAFLCVCALNWIQLVIATFARGKPWGAVLLLIFGWNPIVYLIAAGKARDRLDEIHISRGLPTGMFGLTQRA